MNESMPSVSDVSIVERVSRALKSAPWIGEIEEWKRRSHICGVYFLVERLTIVYIGQSENLECRIGQHFDNPEKQFDRVFYFECSATLLDHYEQFLIGVFRPKYNGHPRRLSAAGFTQSELESDPDGLTFEQLVRRAKDVGVWAQTEKSLRANIRQSLARNLRVRFSREDNKYYIHPEVERNSKVQ